MLGFGAGGREGNASEDGAALAVALDRDAAEAVDKGTGRDGGGPLEDAAAEDEVQGTGATFPGPARFTEEAGIGGNGFELLAAPPQLWCLLTAD